MNAERLLQHYEHIADAPDAISRLKRFILDLAVRGKLVPQDSADEPASKLLKRIGAEKASLLNVGKIKKEKPFPPVEDPDFDIPESWQWSRLGIVTSYIQRGKSPKYAASDGAIVVSQRCIQWNGLDLSVAKKITLDSLAQYEDVRFVRNNDLLWNSTGTGTIGRIIRVIDPPAKLVCDSHVTVVRCLLVDADYVCLWLRSDHVYSLIEGRAAGSTNQVELTAQMALNQIVPLPPLAEQHRIVAKVDELMALCDELEAARTERETKRDRLAAASLSRLNTPDPKTFHDDARFALDVLPALTARPDQIKQLRKTILNLAVRGKLVPQDSADEPVEELLKRIAKEKARLLRLGEIKRDKVPSEISLDDVPFSLPVSWQWCRLRSLASALGDGLHGTPSYVSGTEYYFVNGNNLEDGHIVIKPTTKSVPLAEVQKHRRPLNEYSVLVSINGTLGKVAFYGGQEIVLGKSACYVNLTAMTNRWFAKLVLDSPYFMEYAEREATGTTIKNLSLNAMNELPIPLPPLAEQHRIVGKVDELMAVCDQLEASLIGADETRKKLLNALLAEALAPVDAEALREAAE